MVNKVSFHFAIFNEQDNFIGCIYIFIKKNTASLKVMEKLGLKYEGTFKQSC